MATQQQQLLIEWVKDGQRISLNQWISGSFFSFPLDPQFMDNLNEWISTGTNSFCPVLCHAMPCHAIAARKVTPSGKNHRHDHNIHPSIHFLRMDPLFGRTVRWVGNKRRCLGGNAMSSWWKWWYWPRRSTRLTRTRLGDSAHESINQSQSSFLEYSNTKNWQSTKTKINTDWERICISPWRSWRENKKLIKYK